MTTTPTAKSPTFRLCKTILLALGGLPICGCGALVTGLAWTSGDEIKPSSDQVVVVGEVRTQATVDYVNRFALMALFAKAVYRRDLPESTRNTNGCDYLDGKADAPGVGMPRSADGSGWKRWTGTPDIKSCVNENGLSFETYVHENARGDLDEAVIAYRGTENFNVRESLSDWAANLSAAIGAEPPQYAAAQGHLRAIVGALKIARPGIPIYATGHSLGGGLAQQAGYLSKDIVAVFAFDPSPVTNWSQLQIRKQIDNPDPTIYRVYHWHEGLAYVRNVTSRFNTRRLGRSDYEFYFQEVSPIAAHEMGILACHLSQRIQGPMADHAYPRQFAQAVVAAEYGRGYPEHPICPQPAVQLAR